MFTRGTANADVLNGSAGDDTLYGAAGNDKLTGNAGNDVLTGDAGADTLLGGDGDDYLMGGAGNDLIDGGAGEDWASYEDATAAVKVDLNLTTAQNTLGGGTDTLKGIENLYGSAFNDVLLGNAGVNYLHGGGGADSLFGANGDDHLEGGAGDDTLNGGNGDDVVSYEDGLAGGVTIDLNLTTAQTNGAHGSDTLISIEAVWGSVEADKLTGNGADNYLYGGNGADTLSGGAGADVLIGGDGNDLVIGGTGADALTGGAGDDLFKIAAGDSGTFTAAGIMTAGTNDAITDFQGGARGAGTAAGTGDTLDFGLTVGTSTNYTETTAASLSAAQTAANTAFAANSVLRYIATQVGGDVQLFASDADGGQAASLVTLKGVSTSAIGFNNIAGTAVVVPPPPPNPNLITGTASSELLAGSSTAAETLLGLAGDDTLVGDGSQDTLYGGDGDDVFKFDIRTGVTTVDGGNGVDTLDFSGSTTPAYGILFDMRGAVAGNSLNGDEQPKIAFSNIENLTGTNYYDILIGDNGANVIRGGGGDDAVSGMDGDDILLGGDGNDRLSGNNGADVLDGGTGDDTLYGLAGADTLTGAAGNDLFWFAAGDSSPGAPDKILDFQSGDRLDFSLNLGTATNYVENSAASLSTAQIQANSAFAANAALRYVATQVGSDVQLFVSVPTGGSVESLVTLTGVSTSTIDFNNIVGTTPPPPPPPPVNPNLITGTEGAEALLGTSGADTINGLGGADTITGGQGVDILTGGNGDDLFKFAAGDSVFAASTPTTVAVAGDVIVDFQGGSRGTGTAGGTGDTLDFGLNLGTAANYVETSAATPSAAQSQAASAFAANADLRYLAAQVGGDVVLFTSDADGGQVQSAVTLRGVSTAAVGFDNILGTLPPPPNQIIGTTDRDTLVGGAGSDSLTGLENNDLLLGDAGNDTLFGGLDQDTLVGGVGADFLNGGSGLDRFVFGSGESGVFAASGVVTPGTIDTITDFQTFDDVITFGAGFGNATVGTGNYRELSTLYTTYADAEAAAKVAFGAQGSLVYVVAQVGAGSYLFVDTGGGDDADSVVFLQGVTLSGIAATDIV